MNNIFLSLNPGIFLAQPSAATQKAEAKVVSNIYRHAQICHNANKKYLNSLTVVEDKEDIEHEIEKLSS